jgi:hypothetical protein
MDAHVNVTSGIENAIGADGVIQCSDNGYCSYTNRYGSPATPHAAAQTTDFDESDDDHFHLSFSGDDDDLPPDDLDEIEDEYERANEEGRLENTIKFLENE